MTIDTKYHPNIIGKKGSTINKIRAEFEVRIQLPDKEQENGKDIVIIGYEHQVKATKDALMKIVRELVSGLTSLNASYITNF